MNDPDRAQRIQETAALIAKANEPKEEAAPAAPPKDDAPIAAVDNDEEDDTEDSAASDGTDAPARHKNKGVGKRINELTKDKHDANRRAELLEAENERLRARLTPQQEPPAQAAKQQAPTDDPEPQIDDKGIDFDQSAHLKAMIAWDKRQDQKKAVVVARQETFAQKEAAFIAENPDYIEVSRNPSAPITQAMAEMILEAENAPAIAYYLGKNVAEAAAIAAMSAIAAARAIGRIEANLSRAQETPAASVPTPPKTVTKAPPPVSMVSSSSPSTKPLSNWTVEDHIAAVRANKQRG